MIKHLIFKVFYFYVNMDDDVKNLADATLIFKYNLPNQQGQSKVVLTQDKDHCYEVIEKKSFIELIYKAILNYAYSEFDLQRGCGSEMFSHALGNKFKYNIKAGMQAKKSYGVYGEIVLYIMLCLKYDAECLISKGYLYNPLEKAEAKGYDAYHLIESDGNIDFWFGEAKFYVDYKKAIDRVFENIEKALSDNYFKTNLFAISNNNGHIESKNNKVNTIFNELVLGKTSMLMTEIRNGNIKLIYPVLIVFQQLEGGYDSSIKQVVDYVNSTYSNIKFSDISITYSIFFIFIPIQNVSIIKEEIIKCIEKKKYPI